MEQDIDWDIEQDIDWGIKQDIEPYMRDIPQNRAGSREKLRNLHPLLQGVKIAPQTPANLALAQLNGLFWGCRLSAVDEQPREAGGTYVICRSYR